MVDKSLRLARDYKNFTDRLIQERKALLKVIQKLEEKDKKVETKKFEPLYV